MDRNRDYSNNEVRQKVCFSLPINVKDLTLVFIVVDLM